MQCFVRDGPKVDFGPWNLTFAQCCRLVTRLHRTVVNGWQVCLVRVESVRWNALQRKKRLCNLWMDGELCDWTRAIDAVTPSYCCSCLSCSWLHSTGGVNANKLSCTHEIREKITRKNIKMVQRCLLLDENNKSGIQQTWEIKRKQTNQEKTTKHGYSEDGY